MTWAILRAQIWELWRLTRLELLVRFLMPTAFLWLFVYRYTVLDHYIDNVFYQGILVASLTSLLWVNSFRQRDDVGFPFPLYFSRPQPTWCLVLTPLLWMLVTNTLLYLALVTVAWCAFDIVFPGLSMLPAVALATVLLATVAWATSFFFERVLAGLFLSGVSLVWFAPRLSNVQSLETTSSRLAESFRLTAMENTVMVAATVACAGLCIYFIRRQRCGDTDGILNRFGAAAEGDIRLTARSRAFRSPREAQVWFEARRTMRRSLVVTLVGLCIVSLPPLALLFGIGDVVIAAIWSSVMVTAVLALLLCTVEAVLGVRYHGHVARLSVFDATQPVTVNDALRSKMAVIIPITLGGCALMALGVASNISLLTEDTGQWEELFAYIADMNASPLGILFGAGVLLCLIACAVIVCAICALLTLSIGYGMPLMDRYKAPVTAFMAVTLLPLYIPRIERLLGTDLRVLGATCLFFAGFTMIGTTLLSIRYAVCAGHRSAKGMVGLIAGWILLLALASDLALGVGVEIPTMPIQGAVFVAGLLSIPLAVVAWAPLSLAALRNQ